MLTLIGESGSSDMGQETPPSTELTGESAEYFPKEPGGGQ